MKRRLLNRIIIACIIVGAFFTQAYPNLAAEPPKYRDYLKQADNQSNSVQNIAISLENYLPYSNNTLPQLTNNYYGKEKALAFTADNLAATFQFNVKSTGVYNLSLSYYALKGKAMSIDFSLLIDGQYPFDDAKFLNFSRIYKNETDEKLYDKKGNQYAPRQVEAFLWQNTKVKNPTGDFDEPLSFYLEAGEHTLTILNSDQYFMLSDFMFTAPTNLEDYKTYLAKQPSLNSGNDTIMIEGENATFKSDSVLRPIADATNPKNSPAITSNLKMNTIGGQSWQTPAQFIEWEFETKKEGFYALSFRFQQNFVTGSYTNRRIYIDEKIPFKELSDVKFKYADGWQYLTVGGKEPNYIYLTKGLHKIKMEVVLGELASSFDNINNVIFNLNALYRRIIMITGSSPDPYRDYYLEKDIKDLINVFDESAKTLNSEINNIKKITGSNALTASTLDVLARQLKDMLNKPETIPARLDSFKSNIGGLATWLSEIKNQPLQLDYIVFAEKNANKVNFEANIIDQFVYSVRSFILSFFIDYNILGQEDSKSAITVWVGSGREQAQIIQGMIMDDFYPKKGIAVNLKLVNSSLVEAFLSGQAPDVAIMTGRGQPVNLAVRGALADLSQFYDFGSVKQRFLPSALVPYEFSGGCFGVADTEIFYMLFYRKDIFEELGIKAPNTWNEFYDLIPKIQRYNMDVGLPYTGIDASGSVDSGMGVRNIFPALLLQSGGAFYTENRKETALGNPTAIEAFKKWTSFYTKYSLPLTYDFFNRFRTGEMPLVIAPYTEYGRITAAAPEIRGLWDMIPIPGTEINNKIDRTQAGAGSASVILNNSKNKNNAWEFLKWWTDASTQTRYGQDVEAGLGLMARQPTSNTEALNSLGWTKQQHKNIIDQWNFVVDIPEVPGSYSLVRGLDNAFREVVYDRQNEKETLAVWNKTINDEIKRKRGEFGLD